MSLIINNVVLNKEEILALIHNNSKIQAIKYVRDSTKLGLKESKDIVDNLADDPNFYDGKINTAEIPDIRFSEQPSTKKPFRGNHIKSNRSPQIKNYVIVFLLLCILFLQR